MIKRVRIKGYKSLRNVEVYLSSLSVLFGPNAAGKSNFLDALQLLSRIATSRNLKEAFEPPYRGKPLESYWFGDGGIEGLLKKESAAFSIEVDVELSPAVVNEVNRQIAEMKSRRGLAEEVNRQVSEIKSGEGLSGNGGAASQREPEFIRRKNLRYRIEVEILPKAGLLKVADEYLAPLGGRGQTIERPSPYLEMDQKDNRFHLRMEGQSHPAYFDRYVDHSIISRPHYPPHYPHLTALKKEMESWFFFYLEPRERMRASTPVKEVRHIGLMGEELAAFLNTLNTLSPRQFRAVEKALHSIIPSITGIRPEVNKMGEVELSLLEGNTLVPARVVSEGTLRILGLLALAGVQDPPAVIGFEEPENGIPPRRIRDIAELLTNRTILGETQLIVTTHSPILPDLVPDGSLFVCRKDEGETLIEPLSHWGPLSKSTAVDSALDDKEIFPVSARMLRGDFDA